MQRKVRVVLGREVVRRTFAASGEAGAGRDELDFFGHFVARG